MELWVCLLKLERPGRIAYNLHDHTLVWLPKVLTLGLEDQRKGLARVKVLHPTDSKIFSISDILSISRLRFVSTYPCIEPILLC